MFMGLFDKLFIPLYLAGSVGMFAVLLAPLNTGSGTGPAFIGTWVLLYAITLAAAFVNKAYINKKDLLIFLFPLFFMVTTLWSLQTGKTFTYSFVLFLNAIYLARRVSVKNIGSLIMVLIISLCALGLLANILGFEATNYVDIHNRPTILGTRPIKGFFFHKIMAGYFSGMAAFLCFIHIKGMKKYGALAFLLLFNLLSGSSSGLALFFIGIVLLFLIWIFVRLGVKQIWFLVFILGSAVLTVLAFKLFGEYVLSLLERDPTLTGRTLLWQLGLDASFEKFFQGWGYLGYNGTEVARIDALKYLVFNNYDIPHFHNSYIQYLVDAGWIWGSIFIGLYFYTLVHWYGKVLETRSPVDMAITCILLYMMIAGVFIHTLGRYNDLSMIFFFYALSNTVHRKTKNEPRVPLRPLKSE